MGKYSFNWIGVLEKRPDSAISVRLVKQGSGNNVGKFRRANNEDRDLIIEGSLGCCIVALG